MLEANFISGYETVTVQGLTQWDKGQQLQITGLATLPATFQVHYANNTSVEAVVMLGSAVDGVGTVDIPNSILESELDFKAWVYIIDAEGSETIKTILLPVVARTKPADFISEPNPTEQTMLEEALANVNAVTANMQTEIDGFESQLADKANQVDFDATNVLVSQKVNYSDTNIIGLSQLTTEAKAAMTGGSVAVVGIESTNLQQLNPTMQNDFGVWNTYAAVINNNKKYVEAGGVVSLVDDGYTNSTSINTTAGSRYKVTARATAAIVGIYYVDDSMHVIGSDMVVAVSTNFTDYEVKVPPGASKMLINSSYVLAIGVKALNYSSQLVRANLYTDKIGLVPQENFAYTNTNLENIDYSVRFLLNSNVINGLPSGYINGSGLVFESKVYYLDKTNYFSVVQTLFDCTNNKMFVRIKRYLASIGQNWTSWTTLNGEIITVGASGCNYTKLTDAILNAKENTTIVVNEGVYDFITELGDAYFTNYVFSGTNYGITLPSGCKLKMCSGAKILCNYTGSNNEVKEFFSPLNSLTGDIDYEDIVMEASNVKYCIHDEHGGVLKPYKVSYKRFNLYLDNSNNPLSYSKSCIGGGLGWYGTIEIEDGICESVGVSVGGTISYHTQVGGDGAVCRLNIHNNILVGADNTIRVYSAYTGEGSQTTVATVNNNSLGKAYMTDAIVKSYPYLNEVRP